MKQQKTSATRKKQATKEVIVERTQTTRVPVVEIRKPATLAQALTEPQTAVIKPRIKVVHNAIRRAG